MPAGSADMAAYAPKDIALDSNGRILVGGDFTKANGAGRTNIARLMPDGKLDASFNSGFGPNFHVGAIVAQNDGKAIIGGFFTSVGGISRNRIARLNVDGSLDASFDVGGGADAAVYGLALQSDNRVLLAGTFQTINGTPRSYVARLLNNPLPLHLDLAAAPAIPTLRLRVTGSAQFPVAIESSTNLLDWTLRYQTVLPISGLCQSTDSVVNAISGQFYRAAYR